MPIFKSSKRLRNVKHVYSVILIIAIAISILYTMRQNGTNLWIIPAVIAGFVIVVLVLSFTSLFDSHENSENLVYAENSSLFVKYAEYSQTFYGKKPDSIGDGLECEIIESRFTFIIT